MMASQTPFVGPERLAIVAQLLDTYDEVVATRRPRWVSLEAPAGWGKTRIVQEFYGRLAVERQRTPRYWPVSLVDAVPEAAAGRAVEQRRKRVYPQRVDPPDGATPPWFWWGVTCASRAGTPSQALADDVTQFDAHREELLARWRQLSGVSARAWQAWVTRRSEVAETGFGEALQLAGDAANLAVPGSGFLVMLGKWGYQTLTRGGGGGPRTFDAADRERQDLVEEIVAGVTMLVEAGIPLVFAIEDLHAADHSLVTVVRRLMGLRAPVLVITTSWPGLLDEHDRPPAPVLQELDDRGSLVRVAGRSLPEALDSEARARIVNSLLPELDAESQSLVARRFDNPYALELACSLGRLRRQIERDGRLTADVVDRLPMEIHDLLAMSWSELPETARRLLALGAIATPVAVSAQFGVGDGRWDAEAVRLAAGFEWADVQAENLQAELERATSAYGWVREVDQWLRRFVEDEQRDIAFRHAREQFHPADVRDFYRAAATQLRIDGPDLTSETVLVRARLLVGLASEGFVDWDPLTLDAALALIRRTPPATDEDLRFVHTTARTAVAGADESLHRTPTALWLRDHAAWALGQLGLVRDAMAAYEALVDDVVAMFGPDDPQVLGVRLDLIDLSASTRPAADVVDDYRALRETVQRALGPGHPLALRLARSLAMQYVEAGEHGEAEQLLHELMQSEQDNGDREWSRFATRATLAEIAGARGRPYDAVAQLRELAIDAAAALEPNHPTVLGVRHVLGTWLGHAGEIPKALDLLVDVVDSSTELRGPDHPVTLSCRHSLGIWLHEVGRHEEALHHLDDVHEARERTLGPGHRDTLASRQARAGALGELGGTATAIEELRRVDDQLRQFREPTHPDVVKTRNNLALWLRIGGEPEESIAVLKDLLEGCSGLHGDHPDVLTAKSNLAASLHAAGMGPEAVQHFRDVVKAQSKVLDEHHPSRLTTLANLANVLADAGHPDEAVGVMDGAVAGLTAVFDSDHPEVLTARENLADLLVEAGRCDEGVELAKDVLGEVSERRGPTDPEVLSALNVYAMVLFKCGRFATGATVYDRIAAFHETMEGPTSDWHVINRRQSIECLVRDGQWSAARSQLVAFEPAVLELTVGEGALFEWWRNRLRKCETMLG